MTTTLFRRRLAKERLYETLPPREQDKPILSENPKTWRSLNLPVITCAPSVGCAQSCYACQGRMAWDDVLVKSLQVHRLLIDDPEGAADRVQRESKGRPVRWAGSGDGVPHYLPFLQACKDRGIKLWGFTRKPSFWLAARAIGYLFMFSVDHTMFKTTRWTWAMRHVPKSLRAYLRRPTDPDRSRTMAVTFPLHGPITPHVNLTPISSSDCPGLRDHIPCSDCRTCW